MRIGELSRRSGVPVPTIKFYVREGLLPAGQLTSPNQASYDSGHERRLKLIRALLDVGGLSLAAIGDVLHTIDDPAQPVHNVLGVAAKRITALEGSEPGPELEDAREEVAELLVRRGWRAEAHSPAGEALAGVLVALRRAGHGGSSSCSTTTRPPRNRSPGPTSTMWGGGWRARTWSRVWSSARCWARRCSVHCAGSHTWTRRQGRTATTVRGSRAAPADREPGTYAHPGHRLGARDTRTPRSPSVLDGDRGVPTHKRRPGAVAYAALSCSRSTCSFHSRFTERHASSF